MEQKKSKVTSVVQGQDWVGKQGVFHTWTVRFENGDVGGNMTKQGNNCAFKVGETVDYTIEPGNRPDSFKVKIVPTAPSSFSGGGGGGKGKVNEAGINANVALNNATLLFCKLCDTLGQEWLKSAKDQPERIVMMYAREFSNLLNELSRLK